MPCRSYSLLSIIIIILIAYIVPPTLVLAVEADTAHDSLNSNNDATGPHARTFAVESLEIESYTSIDSATTPEVDIAALDLANEAQQNLANKESLFLPSNAHSQVKILSVPYLNQRWDTEDGFDGAWACGAASAVMVLAHFEKLPPHPINCSLPSPHSSKYGWYVSHIYIAPTAEVFDHCQLDASGNKAFGAWAACTENGGAWAHLMQEYLQKHGLIAEFHSQANFALIQSAIDEKSLILLSTQLSPHGHLILVRGYTANNKIIANDPWGNAALPGWPSNGNGVTYDFDFLRPKYCLVIRLPASSGELDFLSSLPSRRSYSKRSNC